MQRENSHLYRWTLYVLMYGFSILIIFPFIWLFLNTFKDNIELISSNNLFPKVWVFTNYVTAVSAIPMFLFFKNSLFVTILGTLGCVFASGMSAFVFAKLDFKGRNFLFLLVLAIMMIPAFVTLIPLFIIFKSIGLINNLWVLILPMWTGSAFGVFFLRQHMKAVPHELFESAKMEGCNPFRIFISIYFPLVKAALATLSVLMFIAQWNDLLNPLIYLYSPEKMTVSVGLTYFMGQYVTNYPVLLAGIILSLIPTFLVFLFAQKYITQGMLISGIK
jgi:multiple sugar transport system permease protein